MMQIKIYFSLISTYVYRYLRNCIFLVALLAPDSPMQVEPPLEPSLEPPLEHRAPVEPLEINDVDMAARSKKCLTESFNSTTDGGKGKRNGRQVSAPQRKSLEVSGRGLGE